MSTETTAEGTASASDYGSHVAALVADREAQAAGFAARVGAPVERVPMDVYMHETIAHDGGEDYVAVPQGEANRERFIAAFVAARNAQHAGTSELVAQLADYQAASELERVRRWPSTDERAVLARMTHARSPI